MIPEITLIERIVIFVLILIRRSKVNFVFRAMIEWIYRLNV